MKLVKPRWRRVIISVNQTGLLAIGAGDANCDATDSLTSKGSAVSSAEGMRYLFDEARLALVAVPMEAVIAPKLRPYQRSIGLRTGRPRET